MSVESQRGAAGCAYCSSKRKGLCGGVEDDDEIGKRDLESARSALRVYAAGEVIYRQGDPRNHVFNLISGWASLQRQVVDGRHQIVRFLLPGASFGFIGASFDETAVALTPCRVCPIERSKFDKLRRGIPSLNERLLELLETDNHRVTENVALVGVGGARERVAALVCELALRAAGGTPLRNGLAIKMPITQLQIAEATGLTAIHVNRVLRRLRETGVFELREGELTVIDPEKMQRLAKGDFEPEDWAAILLPRERRDVSLTPRAQAGPGLDVATAARAAGAPVVAAG
jgi:CRP-like cAMP-binding protein